jgi:alkylhydroperoxidase/carboxymuconolactone decarboxylase family protein YurZ
MSKNPMDTIRNLDGELVDAIEGARKLAFHDGALSRKMKYLIALGIDASHGAEEGIRSLALQAQKNGASKEEIMEVLRIAYFVSGVGSIYAASRVLGDLF